MLEELFTRGLTDDIARIARCRRQVSAIDRNAADIDQMKADAERAASTILGIVEQDPDAKVWLEQEVFLQFTAPELSGTADIILWLPTLKELWVIDYKYGRVEIDAFKNPQIAMYLMGALESLVETHHDPAVKLRGMIVQPRGGNKLSVAEFDRDWLRNTFRPKITRALATIEPEKYKDWYFGETLEPEYVISEDGCRWCPVMAECPAVREKAIAACDFKPIGKVEPPPLEECLDLVPVLKQWIAAIEDTAMATLQDGGEVPGYALKETQGNRRWQDEAAVRDYLEDESDLVVDDYAPRKLLSPAQMDKLVKKSSKIIAPKDLGLYSARPVGNPRLVKIETGET
jgi:hypothetical protein